jgi:hypothetical protein
MRREDEWYTTEPDVPIVDEHVVQVLRESHDIDPENSRAMMHRTVEDDPKFAHQIVIEANRRSDGDMGRQEAFIQGANFAREALRRTITINQIRELFSFPDMARIEEDLENPDEAAA